jgi:hypothetical protein
MDQNPYQAPAGIAHEPRPFMICQNCGIEAPTRYVVFYQNIGALFVRFHKTIRGYLCKSCVHRRFWEFTLIDCTLGWWGTISIVVTPFFIINNIGRYAACLFMPRVPSGAARPRLTDDAIGRIRPHMDVLIKRLNAGDGALTVAHDIAALSGVTPGQVILYIQALIAASRNAAK